MVSYLLCLSNSSLILSYFIDFRFTSSTGLFPSIFNLASHAKIQANATCGLHKSEVYCTLEERGQSSRCGVCDNSDPDKAHPPELAIDGSDRWWQSPSLQYGPAYHSVTLTINLNKIYQVINKRGRPSS